MISPNIYIQDQKLYINYFSGVKWNINKSGELQSYYHIKSARDNDPFEWDKF